jgi:hypothetical protein
MVLYSHLRAHTRKHWLFGVDIESAVVTETILVWQTES